MTTYEIPLSGEPENFTVSLAGTEYRISVWYKNVDEGGWIIDISTTDDSPLINGVPLVTGIDLLRQYKYLGIAGELWVGTDGDIDAVPTYDNLGTASHLYFITE